MQNFVVNGNIQFAPAPDAQNTTVPITQQITFTMLVADQLVYNAPVTNQVLPLGTVSNAKALYLEVISGACTLKLASGDSAVVALGLGATPLPTDRSSFMICNPIGVGSLAPVISVSQACQLKLYVVQ